MFAHDCFNHLVSTILFPRLTLKAYGPRLGLLLSNLGLLVSEIGSDSTEVCECSGVNWFTGMV